MAKEVSEHDQAPPPAAPLNLFFSRPAGTQEYRSAPIGEIVPGRWQPRITFDQAALEELARSIREHGITDPLLVFHNEQGWLELIGGERRLRAAAMAGLTVVPVHVIEGSPEKLHRLSARHNEDREQLNRLERGRMYVRYREEHSLSDVKAAQALGASRADFQQHVAFAQSAPELQDAFLADRITWTQARGIFLAAPGNHTAQRTALEAVIAKLAEERVAVREDDARGAAAKAVAKDAGRELKRLGWFLLDRASSYEWRDVLVWGGGERPRPWSSTEILTGVREQWTPDGLPPEETLDHVPADRRNALAVVGYQFDESKTAPWIEVRRGYNAEPSYLSAIEVRALGEKALGEIAEVRARLAPHGWQFAIKGATQFVLESAAGRCVYCWYWKDVLENAGKIEAGTLDAAPEIDEAPRACDTAGCDAQAERFLSHLRGHGQFCGACAERLEAERDAHERERVEAIIGELQAGLELLTERQRAILVAALGASGGDGPVSLNHFDRADKLAGLVTGDPEEVSRRLAETAAHRIRRHEGANAFVLPLLGIAVDGSSDASPIVEDEEEEAAAFTL